jgi:hypothetical protein
LADLDEVRREIVAHFGHALARASDPDMRVRERRIALNFADAVAQRARYSISVRCGGARERGHEPFADGDFEKAFWKRILADTCDLAVPVPPAASCLLAAMPPAALTRDTSSD